MIPLNETHLRSILKEYVTHYNRGRPHSALGPGCPGGKAPLDMLRYGRDIPKGHRVEVTAVLGGLHDEISIGESRLTSIRWRDVSDFCGVQPQICDCCVFSNTYVLKNQ